MAFEVISERPITDSKPVSSAISKKALDFLGELGCAEAGIILLNDKYNAEKQKGLIRVNNKSLDKLRATLALIDQIDGQNVIVRSVGASGIIKKAEGRYLAA
ncbi:MAG: Rpp14/Pop5 family protein [Candidatus Woesearchaeota archaeon]